MTQPASAQVASELANVLTRLGDALATTDLDGLLASEASLSTIATHLSRLQRLTGQEREALRPELERARAALARCERLGSRLQGLTGGALAVSVATYTRQGGTDRARPSAQMEAKT